MAKPSTRRNRFRTGDVFQVALPDGSFAYGRILLDLRRLARAGLFVTPCALAGMCGSALLVRLYKKAFPSPTLSMAELTEAHSFVGELLDGRPIYRGDDPIVGTFPYALANWISRSTYAPFTRIRLGISATRRAAPSPSCQ